MERRSLLVGGGMLAAALVGGVALVSGGDESIEDGQAGGSATPGTGASTGPTAGRRLVFEDAFEDIASIDLTGRGEPGKRWYTDMPYGWGTTAPEAVQVSEGVLTLTGASGRNNYCIGSMSPTTGQGRAFSHGYFEARMAFDPADAPGSDGFPAFWAGGAQHFVEMDQNRNIEVDIFEAMHPSGQAGRSFDDTFAGTVHEWQLVNGETDAANYGDNTVQLRGTDWTAWHDYGCEWVPGRLRWFLDQRVVLEQRYGANVRPNPNSSQLDVGTFSALEADDTQLVLILGTGSNYPLRVDRVRVWQ